MILFKRIGEYFKLLLRLNILKTIYLNFRVFPWSTAIKIPIYIFGPVKFPNLSGQVSIEGLIRRGMIQFGCDDENIIATHEPTRIYVSGKLVFRGSCKFAKATQILVWDKGVLEIGDSSWLGSFTKVVVFGSVSIGKNFMSSWECQIFDTDFHFIINKSNKTVADNIKPVTIGERVWLGSRVSVLKGTALPDETIVAASSLCNANYSERYSNSIILGGVPAKLLTENVVYVSDKGFEKHLFSYFQNQPSNEGYFQL